MKDRRAVGVFLALGMMLLSGVMIPSRARAETFTDDFNRADVTATTSLGPGWLSGTNATSGAFYDRWSIASQTAVRFDGGARVYATNFALGKVYQVEADVKLKSQDLLLLAGNWNYMVDKSCVFAIFQPTIRRIMLRVYDGAGSSVDFGYQTAASLTVDAWYRYTLSRSNNYVRSTLVGTDANLDTGWVTDASMAGIDRGGYAGMFQNNNMYFDNFAVSNKYLPKGTIFTIR